MELRLEAHDGIVPIVVVLVGARERAANFARHAELRANLERVGRVAADGLAPAEERAVAVFLGVRGDAHDVVDAGEADHEEAGRHDDL